MDVSYEECFADDESDISESSLSRDDIHNGQIHQDIVESLADNECVFDTEWALKRKYSLSSLLYSRLLLRLKSKMKTALSWSCMAWWRRSSHWSVIENNAGDWYFLNMRNPAWLLTLQHSYQRRTQKLSNEKHYTHENNLYLILEWRNTMRICHKYIPMIELSIYSIESQDINTGMKPASDITNNGRG